MRRALPTALLVAGVACEGRFGVGMGRPPVPRRDSGPVVLIDSGPRDAFSPPGVDAFRPPTDAAMCVPPGDRRSSAVYYGTREDTTLMLSPGQVLAIARLQGGGGICSGTVIAPRWVLSAKHCYPSIDASAMISVGPDPDNPTFRLTATRAIVHPSIDLMLLELSADATTTVPGLVPVPIFPNALTSLMGRTVECAGYGQQESGRLGQRRFTAQPIVSFDGSFFTVDGEGRHGLCGGDSGGPCMVREAGTVYTLGALTGGDPSCVGRDNYTRVDSGRDWITMHTGSGPVDPCAGVTLAGRCEGDTAVWCEAGAIRRRMCGACGFACGTVASVGGVDCMPR